MSAQGDDLTLAEAVPLATVLLQRLLADAGVRSLAIKGPAFVELGVRAAKQSNDVDLLIHPDDRADMDRTLRRAGWWKLSYYFPPEIDDVVYSTTYAHPRLPSSVDVHHTFPGLLMDRRAAFEALWADRRDATLAHHTVVTTSAPHALVLETLNRLKSTREAAWGEVAGDVVKGLGASLTAEELTQSASLVGAERTVSPVVVAMGGVPVRGHDPAYDGWRRACRPSRSGDILTPILRRAPRSLPRVIWHQVTLGEGAARVWAQAHNVPYRNRWQVLGYRIVTLLRARATKRD